MSNDIWRLAFRVPPLIIAVAWIGLFVLI